MVEPLSITTACLGLISSVTNLSIKISNFVSSVRDARRDMDAVLRELTSLSLCLRTLQNDCSGSAVDYPLQLKQSLIAILKNCGIVASEMHKLLTKASDSMLGASLYWTTSGRTEMDKLRYRLESHKLTIDVALDMVSM
jgi:Fungal N-terminal domain of STAND proteins